MLAWVLAMGLSVCLSVTRRYNVYTPHNSPRNLVFLCLLLPNRVSTGGNTIASVRPFVSFPFYLTLNRVTFDLDLLHVCGS